MNKSLQIILQYFIFTFEQAETLMIPSVLTFKLLKS